MNICVIGTGYVGLVTAACLPLYYYRHQIVQRFHRKSRMSRPDQDRPDQNKKVG